MSNFKIGDYVKVHGHQNSIYFNGEIGIIEVLYEDYPMYGIMFGIDFAQTGFLNPSLHTLNGYIKTKTGYFVEPRFLTLVKRMKTGFGKFIERIENGV